MSKIGMSVGFVLDLETDEGMGQAADVDTSRLGAALCEVVEEWMGEQAQTLAAALPEEGISLSVQEAGAVELGDDGVFRVELHFEAAGGEVSPAQLEAALEAAWDDDGDLAERMTDAVSDSTGWLVYSLTVSLNEAEARAVPSP